MVNDEDMCLYGNNQNMYIELEIVSNRQNER